MVRVKKDFTSQHNKRQFKKDQLIEDWETNRLSIKEKQNLEWLTLGEIESKKQSFEGKRGTRGDGGITGSGII